MSTIGEPIPRNIRVILLLAIVAILFQQTCSSTYRTDLEKSPKRFKSTSLSDSLKVYYHSKNKTANELDFGKQKRLIKPSLTWKDSRTKELRLLERSKRKIDVQTNERLAQFKSKRFPDRFDGSINRLRRSLSSLWKRSLDSLSNDHLDSFANVKKKHEKKCCKTGDNKYERKNYKKFETIKSTAGPDEEQNHTNYATEMAERVQQENTVRISEGKNGRSIGDQANRLRRSYSTSSGAARKGQVERPKRSVSFVNDRTANIADYYEQKRRIMERFYARQREIASRYNKQNNSLTNTVNYEPRDRGSTSPVPDDRRLAHRQFTTEDYGLNDIHKFDEQLGGLPMTTPNGFKVVLGLTPDSSTRQPVVNVGTDAFGYYTTPPTCANASLSGTFAPKTRATKNTTSTDNSWKQNPAKNRGDVPPDAVNSTGNSRVWGTCVGKIVYQHNLNLSLTGNISSELDTMVEIFLDGPLCISCVVIEKIGGPRVMISVENGGPGFNHVILRVYEKQGFYYIIKIWGTLKLGTHCPRDVPKGSWNSNER